METSKRFFKTTDNPIVMQKGTRTKNVRPVRNMKKRLLTALVGVSFAVAWMFTIYTPLYSAILAVFAAIAVYEMLKVFGVTNKVFFVLCELIGVGTLLFPDYLKKYEIPLFPVFTVLLLLSMIIMVADFKRLKFEQVVCSLFSAVMIPAALSCVIMMRDVYIDFPGLFRQQDGVFFILLAFFCSWISDGCALFAGMAFGKHKLAPNISPKKTVEGAVGGVIGNTLFCVALWAVFQYKFNLSSYIGIGWVIPVSVFLSVISVFGDLAASTIKRHHGIKDFGNLLPGHGGVMDRFDSSIFVFAAEYAIICIMGKIL